MTATPHVLQRHALHELHAHLGDRGRGVVVMPCGSGKTFLGRWLAEQLAARLVVVFVPTLALVPQTVLAYREGAAWRHQTLIVCSDPTSGRAVRLDDLELPAWARSEVTASTSTGAVHAFLQGGGPARVIVSTYHSAPRVAAALQHARVEADLVVCDEAHRLTGRPRAEFRAVLDDTAIPARRRVFLTATPVEAAAWGADVDVDEVDAPLALDDEDLFGPTVYRATFADAVTAGRLVDYDVEILAVRDVEHAGEQPGPARAVLAAIADGSRRVLTFHSRVSSARALARALDGQCVDGGGIEGVHLHAEHLEARHGAHRRTAALARLADPGPGWASVLASARILSEGVDVPAVDTVVFAEPRTSAVDIVQAVGRAMRLAPGKTRGRVVLAVTLPGGVDEDTELSGTAWRHVWVTLRALASMDPRFAARLRARVTGGTAGWPKIGPGLRTDLPDGLDIDRWMLRALDRTGLSWWAVHDQLVAWAREHGHARPGAGPTARRGDVHLGQWVTRQRTLHRQGVLDGDRVDALQKLPGWAWDAREGAWWRAHAVWPGAATVETLRETSAGRPGDGGEASNVTYRSLAHFAVETCARRRRGELPAHLERAADQLPDWRWSCVPDDDAAMVDALREYAEWEKDLNPPHEYVDDDGRPVGAWLTAMRRRRYTGRLHPALELELELLARPGRWTPLRWEKGETGWRLAYLALRQFAAREHTPGTPLRIPYEHVEALPDHELNLSRWCVVQRQERRRGDLSPERVAALEQVPGWLWEIPVSPEQRVVRDDVEHGHRWAYAKGCRCEPCCEANAQYERDRQAGRIDVQLVDAGRARAHLQLLLARGAAQTALARAAGVNPKSIAAIASGAVSRIRPEREQLVLALTVDAAAEHTGAGAWGGTVDAATLRETWKLLDWMLMRGWPKAWISRELGGDGRALQLNRDRMSVRSAEKVAELDRRLGRTRRPPPRAVRAVLPTLDELLAAEQTAS